MATLQDPVTNVTPHRKPPGLASIMVIQLPDEQFSLPRSKMRNPSGGIGSSHGKKSGEQGIATVTVVSNSRRRDAQCRRDA
jgi:hypothetical protein